MSKPTEETRSWNALKEIHGEEWKMRIDLLNEQVRPIIACMVWWDFFGDRTVDERWDHLDEYLPFRVHPDIPKEDIIQGLIDAGYSQKRANWRMKIW